MAVVNPKVRTSLVHFLGLAWKWETFDTFGFLKDNIGKAKNTMQFLNASCAHLFRCELDAFSFVSPQLCLTNSSFIICITDIYSELTQLAHLFIHRNDMTLHGLLERDLNDMFCAYEICIRSPLLVRAPRSAKQIVKTLRRSTAG